MLYYAKIRGRVCGPFPVETVLEMISRGQIGRTSQVSTDGRSWCLAGEREDLFPASNQQESTDESPAAPSGPSLSASRQWYVSNDGKTGTGPYSQQEISTLFQKQQFYDDSLVWKDGVSPTALKSSPDFAFLFPTSGAGPGSEVGYSPAAVTGIQTSGAGEPSTSGSNPFAQEFGSPAAVNEGLSRDAIQVTCRPVAWLLVVNLFMSLGIIMELIFDIFVIRALAEMPLLIGKEKAVASGGTVALAAIILFVVLAFSVWIVVEHWRYFGAIQTFGREPNEIKLMALGRRVYSVWRTWAFFMLFNLLIAIIFVVGAVLVAA